MNGQSTVGDVVAATQRWIHQPFTTSGSLWDWFLIVGVVMIAALLWGRILQHIGE